MVKINFLRRGIKGRGASASGLSRMLWPFRTKAGLSAASQGHDIPLTVADFRLSSHTPGPAGLAITDDTDDPWIAFKLANAPGAGRAYFAVSLVEAPRLRSNLYLDRGAGFSEENKLKPVIGSDTLHLFIIEDVAGLRALRYDPSEQPFGLTVTGCALTRLDGLPGIALTGLWIAGLENVKLDPFTGQVAFGDSPEIHVRPNEAHARARLDVALSSDPGTDARPRLLVQPGVATSIDMQDAGDARFTAVLAHSHVLPVIRLRLGDSSGRGRVAGLSLSVSSAGNAEAHQAWDHAADPGTQAIAATIAINQDLARLASPRRFQSSVRLETAGIVSGTISADAGTVGFPAVELWCQGRLVGAAPCETLTIDDPAFNPHRATARFTVGYSTHLVASGALLSARLQEGPELEGSPFRVPTNSPVRMPPIETRRAAVLRDAEERLRERRPPSGLAGPLISILTPVYNVDDVWLIRMVGSVRRQTYTHWELCLVDDGSPRAGVRTLLAKLAEAEPRLRVKFRPRNGGISAATNDALAMASGAYVALLDNDDMLTCDALHEMATAIAREGNPDWLYSDEFKIDGRDEASQLFAKPDWSPLFLLNYMYTGHLSLYRTDLVRSLGGFRSEYDLSQDYDLALRVAETGPRIVHVEKYLYAWRMIEGSGAQGGKPTARITNIAALQSAAERRGWGGEAVPLPTANRLVRQPGVDKPMISIIIPSDDAGNITTTLASIIENSSYDRYEMVVVTNSGIVDKLASTADHRVVWAKFDKSYNFSEKCNAGVAASGGQYVVFFNDDVRVVTPDWMEGLLEILTLPGVGAVGPKLLYENGVIQHGGMVTGVRRLVGTAFHTYPAESTAYFNMAQCVREVSLLCGACLAMPTAAFRTIGGFDAVNTPISHSDVDLCFKVREAGLSCVYTPHATLVHIGHLSLASVDEIDRKAKRKNKADVYLLERWSHLIARDPYFPPAMRDLVYRDSQEPFTVHGADVAEAFHRPGVPDTLLLSHDLTESGAPKVVYDMALTLQRAGTFVTVLSPLDGPYRRKLIAAGIPVVIDPLALDAQEDSMVIARNFDRVIANTILCWKAVSDLSRFTQVYWYTHETKFVDELAAKHTEFSGALTTPAGLWSGSELAAQALRRHGGRPTVLEYGTDAVSDVTPLPMIKAAMFASYETRKGQDLAVRAMSLLSYSVRKSIRLTVYGRTLDTKFRQTVEEFARGSGNVELSSELDFERYREELTNCNIVVVCSRDDTLPLVSLDALSAGKILVCSLTTGTSAYLEDGVSAMLLKDNSPEEIAAVLERLVLEPALRERVALGGREVFQRWFTVEAFERRMFAKLTGTVPDHAGQ